MATVITPTPFKRARSESQSPPNIDKRPKIITMDNSIVEMCSEQMDINIPDNVLPSFRSMIKLRDKQLRFGLHRETLSKYIQEDLVPRGLKLNLSPSFGKDNKQFMEKWTKIIHNTSIELMNLIVELCDTKVNSNVPMIEKLNVDIQHSVSNTDTFEKINTKIDNIITKRKNRIIIVKEKKFTRDMNARETELNTDTVEVIDGNSYDSKNEDTHTLSKKGEKGTRRSKTKNAQVSDPNTNLIELTIPEEEQQRKISIEAPRKFRNRRKYVPQPQEIVISIKKENSPKEAEIPNKTPLSPELRNAVEDLIGKRIRQILNVDAPQQNEHSKED